MPVMQIGAMRVVVLERVVMVGVRVRAEHRRVVRVIVVPVIVGVRVLMVQRRVAMPVLVTLGNVKIGSDPEDGTCQSDELRAATIACDEGHASAQERRQREQRSGSSRAQRALCAQIQTQAESITGRAACKEREQRNERWPGIVKRDGQAAGESSAERRLPEHHGARIEVSERSRQRVVDSPAERGRGDRR